MNEITVDEGRGPNDLIVILGNHEPSIYGLYIYPHVLYVSQFCGSCFWLIHIPWKSKTIKIIVPQI